MVQKMTLKVTGSQTMHCAGCERSVTFTLSRLPGVKVLKAEHQTQRIELALTGEETGLEQVKEALAWLGYEVATV